MDIKPHTILDEDSIEIDLDVLQRFKSDQYTKGSVIIAHLDKMNPGITYRILSRINKLDFFRWYENLLGINEEGQVYSNLKDLYKMRNDVVHNLYDVEFSTKELLDKIKAYKQFGLHLITFTRLNVVISEKIWSETRINEFVALNLPSNFLDGFKKTTKNFRKNYSPPKRRY